MKAISIRTPVLGLTVIVCLSGQASIALAASMTCESFRHQLSAAIYAAGDRVAQPRLDELAHQRPDGTLRRYRMAGIANLEGNLRCAESDKLEAFGATVKVNTADGALRVHRLIELGSATICAVAPAKKPAACKRLADKLANTAVKGFARAAVRGEETPSDFTTEDIGNGYGIEFDAREGELSFDLVPPAK